MPVLNQAPAELDIRYVAGDTVTMQLNFMTGTGPSAVPLDMTGYTITAVTKTTATIITVTPVNLALGQIRLSLSSYQTSLLIPNETWAITWTDLANNTLTPIQGRMQGAIK